MAKMTKGTSGAKTAGSSKQYLKKGGKYQAGGVKLGPESKAKMKSMTEPTSNPAWRKYKKPMKQNGGVAKDTTGMTFPYISPKGAIYATGKDYMTGTPSSPTDPRNRDYMSKQDSTTQRKTGYTALTKGEKKKGGMVKKQVGGLSPAGKLSGGDPDAKAYRKRDREIRKYNKYVKQQKLTPYKQDGGKTPPGGGMVMPVISKRKKEREIKKYDKYMKKQNPAPLKQNGGDIDFKKASETFKPTPKKYNSEDIKKTLPGVKSDPSKPSKIYPPKPRKRGANEIPYKKKGGMIKSKKK